MSKTCLAAVCGCLGLLFCRAAAAQDVTAPDPCASTVTAGELKLCWAREAARVDREMQKVYEALLATLPPTSAEELKKAQKLWLDFRAAHVNMLTGTRPGERRDTERFTCWLIAATQMARERTVELRRLLHRDNADPCAG